MSFRIKTVLHVNGGEYMLPLPQKQNDLDKYLTEAGVLTGSQSEYSIAEIECDNYTLNQALSGAWDIEELNYLAQRLDRMSVSDFNNYVDIVDTKDGITIRGLINLAINLEDIEIQANITDSEELARRYISDNYAHLDSLVLDNIDYDNLGDDIKREEWGIFTDAGYISNSNTIFLKPIYDGKSFPYFDYENDYSLKIRLCDGMAAGSADEHVDIILPASENVFARAMRRIKANSLHDCSISHYYSERFGEDMMQLFAPDESITALNNLAIKMDQIPEDQIENYKDAVADSLVQGDVNAMTVLTDKFMSGEYKKEKAIRDCREETIRKLTDMAVDMAKTLGHHAESDIEILRNQVTDFINRWDLDEQFIDQFDMDVADAQPKDQPDETEDEESGMGMSMT